jgi:small-conductance mechanosensitive channel
VPTYSLLQFTGRSSAIKIAAAIAFWIIGRWLISRVVGLIQAGMNRNSVDPTLTKYLGSIVTIALNIALVLGIVGYFGIQTTSFAAMLAGAWLVILNPQASEIDDEAQAVLCGTAADLLPRLMAAVTGGSDP